MKSFSKMTKEALCRTDCGELCCCEAEMMGILMFAGRFKGNQVRVSLESRDAIERFGMLIKKCLDVEIVIGSLKSSFFCTLNDKRILSKIIECETSSLEITETFVKSECCRGAFLRGAYLGGGTMTDPQKTYNMEIVTYSKKIHDQFKKLLQEMGLALNTLVKKNSFVLYTKNSDIICDALAYMGAFGPQMEILNIKIEREVRSNLTRTSNGETANMDKVIEASSRHMTAITKIEDRIGLDNLPDELREIAVMRKENKDLSLVELGKRFTPPLSKSGVNHRLKKLLDIAEKL